MVSELDGAVFPDYEDIVFLSLFPVDDLESGMGRFGFPFGFFGLVVGDSALFGADHSPIIYPTYGIDHADNFRVVKDNIDVFVPFHGHVIHGDQHFLTIVSIKGFNL